MRTKNLFLLTLTLVGFLSAAALAAAVALRHEPHFYRERLLPASAERKKLSEALLNELAQLWADVKHRDGKWRHSFTEAQLNSFFDEDFVRLGEADNLRKHGVTDPRIQLEDDKLRLAFRYGKGFWSTIVSYDLRIWLVPREPNTLAIQVLNRRLGAMPISSGALLGGLTDLAKRNNFNIEATVYRHEGCPVVLLRYQYEGSRPNTALQSIKVNPAHLSITGGSAEPDTVAAAP
jgi:hypothetical protein